MSPTQLNPCGQIGLVFKVVLRWVELDISQIEKVELDWKILESRNPAHPCTAALIICALTKKHEAWVWLVKRNADFEAIEY